MTSDVLEGFAPHFRRSGFTDPWEPIFSRVEETQVRLGLRAAAAHANSRGIVHGGLMTTLADNAMGLSCARGLKEGSRLLTIGLTIDFLASGRIGQWIEVDTTYVKTGSSICFAQAFVTADGEPCARASGTFKIAPLRAAA